MTTTIRVAIVDDDQIVRSALSAYLATAPEIEVVAYGQTGLDAVAAVREHPVDVLVMDIRMPELDGVAATAECRQVSPGTRVLLLTSVDGDDMVRRGLAAGASGYLTKDIPPSGLVEGVRGIHAGTAVVSPQTLSQLARTGTQAPEAPPLLRELTEREQEILALLCVGLSNAEIAGRIFLSESTVKTHVSAIMTKLGAQSRLKAVVRAYELGLVGSDGPRA